MKTYFQILIMFIAMFILSFNLLIYSIFAPQKAMLYFMKKVKEIYKNTYEKS